MKLPWHKKPPQKPNPLARPKIVVKEADRPKVTVWREPLWRKRVFTGFCWLAGWCLLTWALADLVGAWGWKAGGGGLLVAAGGLRPLAKVVMGGMVAFPPWDWFKEVQR